MIITPYIVLIAFMILILVVRPLPHTKRLARVDLPTVPSATQVGFQRPDTVTRARRTLYCSLESRLMYALPVVSVFMG